MPPRTPRETAFTSACADRQQGSDDLNNLDIYRAAGNPMFNGNRFKLGIFGSNCSNACAIR